VVEGEQGRDLSDRSLMGKEEEEKEEKEREEGAMW